MATWGSVGKLLSGYTVAGEWERRTFHNSHCYNYAHCYILFLYTLNTYIVTIHTKLHT